MREADGVGAAFQPRAAVPGSTIRTSVAARSFKDRRFSSTSAVAAGATMRGPVRPV